MNELVPTLPGRPLFLERDGWRTWVVIHDQYFLDKKARFRRRMRAVHPDVTGSVKTAAIRGVLADYRNWLKSEEKWYAQFHLVHPEGCEAHRW